MKKIIKENYRVEVYPDAGMWKSDHEDYMKVMRNISDGIKRHVDEVRDTSIEWDAQEICGFCGENWELWEDGEGEGLPACCEKAQKEAKCEAHLKELNGGKK